MSSGLQSGHAQFELDVRRAFAQEALMGTFGAWLVEVKPARVVIELPYSDRIARRNGVFHDAVIGALGETAAVLAGLTLLPAGSEAVRVEYKVNFLRPAQGLLLRAEGRLLAAAHDGVMTARADVGVHGGSNDGLCAALQATLLARAGPVAAP